MPHGFTVSNDGPGQTLLINARQLELPGADVAMPDPERIARISEAHGIRSA